MPITNCVGSSAEWIDLLDRDHALDGDDELIAEQQRPERPARRPASTASKSEDEQVEQRLVRAVPGVALDRGPADRREAPDGEARRGSRSPRPRRAAGRRAGTAHGQTDVNQDAEDDQGDRIPDGAGEPPSRSTMKRGEPERRPPTGSACTTRSTGRSLPPPAEGLRPAVALLRPEARSLARRARPGQHAGDGTEATGGYPWRRWPADAPASSTSSRSPRSAARSRTSAICLPAAARNTTSRVAAHGDGPLRTAAEELGVDFVAARARAPCAVADSRPARPARADPALPAPSPGHRASEQLQGGHPRPVRRRDGARPRPRLHRARLGVQGSERPRPRALYLWADRLVKPLTSMIICVSRHRASGGARRAAPATPRGRR